MTSAWKQSGSILIEQGGWKSKKIDESRKKGKKEKRKK